MAKKKSKKKEKKIKKTVARKEAVKKQEVEKKIKKVKKSTQVFTITMESKDPYVGTIQENVKGKKARFTSAGAQINFVAKNILVPGRE